MIVLAVAQGFVVAADFLPEVFFENDATVAEGVAVEDLFFYLLVVGWEINFNPLVIVINIITAEEADIGMVF